MPRRRRSEKRKLPFDPIYNSVLVTRLINNVMRRGKKSVAERIVYNAFDIIQEKTKKSPLEVFKQALENVRPKLAVKPRRVGGATYQVPVEVPEDKGISMGIKWLITAAKARKGRPMRERLALEIVDAFNQTGAAVKKKEDTHKMAEANRAFAHYKW
jgi:small subunit ribosomal protein S7